MHHPLYTQLPLRWRHNELDGVSGHQPHDCLLNRLFRRRSTKTSKLRVTGLCVGNSPGPVNSPHKGPVTRKMLPFDDVIMTIFAKSKYFEDHYISYRLEDFTVCSTGHPSISKRFLTPCVHLPYGYKSYYDILMWRQQATIWTIIVKAAQNQMI